MENWQKNDYYKAEMLIVEMLVVILLISLNKLLILGLEKCYNYNNCLSNSKVISLWENVQN